MTRLIIALLFVALYWPTPSPPHGDPPVDGDQPVSFDSNSDDE